MNLVGLPARVVYAVVAAVAGGAAGFYGSIWLLPKLAGVFYGLDKREYGLELFTASLGIGAGVAFMAFLLGLTLPWRRRRRRSGRGVRILIASVLVVVTSAVFATQHHALVYDLAFAAWLAYVMAFTYVRYGVLDSHSANRKAVAEEFVD